MWGGSYFLFLKGEFTVKLETIKAALQARAVSLNLNPQEAVAPIIVADKPAAPKHDKPVSDQKTEPEKSEAKISMPPLPLKPTPAQIVKPVDKVPAPTEEAKIPAEKPARKANSRKATVEPVAVSQVDIDAVIAKNLKAGRDYDRLPNTAKPTLFKSGAEILADVFNFRTTAKVINRVENYDKQFVLYEICVTVFEKDGNIVAEGLGSCNSRERRYLKTDFATNLNTILKMAKKRAFVDAILTATHASKVFTQDIEDIVNFQREMNDDRDNNVK